MNCINIFRNYSQAENRYTNGLISLLKIGSKVDNNILIEFGRLIHISLSQNSAFKVLREFEGTADAEILDNESIILIETKIVSGTLSQVFPSAIATPTSVDPIPVAKAANAPDVQV